jgi:hypothetical protein
MDEKIDGKPPDIDEYTINVRVSGYGNLAMDIRVPAKNPDEAFALACSKEFRYLDEDAYVLMVVADDNELSALCTYETLEEAVVHVGLITDGTWILVKRDFEGDGGTIIKTSADEY